MAKAPIFPLIIGAGALYFLSQKDKKGASVDNQEIDKGRESKDIDKDIPEGTPLDPGSYTVKVGEKLTIDHSKLGGTSFQLFHNGGQIQDAQLGEHVDTDLDPNPDLLNLALLQEGMYRLEFPIGPTAVWEFVVISA
jgi:hypothetical protein